MSQKRVAMVLASLVGTLTVSAGMLLLLEGGAMGTSPMGAAVDVRPAVQPKVLLQTGAWKSIIIYESADLAGSADSLAEGRVMIGGNELSPNTVRPKASFHFVIDNAQSHPNGADGKIEYGTAWLKQVAGAPRLDWHVVSPHSSIKYYTDSVGICLIGDVNQEPVSRAQNETLSLLVQELKQKLSLPDDFIRFEWELTGQTTPAQRKFADEFRRRTGLKAPSE